MDIAKSLFGNRPHEGYAGKEDYNEKVDTALSEDEGETDLSCLGEVSEGLSIKADGVTPTPGGPFSALTPSMWPQDILSKLGQQPDDPNSQPEYRFDEFGFRVEEEDGPEQNSNKLLGIPFVEDPQHRLQWVAHLEFSHNKEVCDLTWDKVEVRLPRTEKLRSMVRAGIPHSLRPQMWMRLSGALQKKLSSEMSYKDIVKASSNDALMTSKQIEKDLLRTMPGNACFSHMDSTGIPRLRRVLRGLAWLYPDIGYCQGTGMVASSLLLLMEEEDAFWMLSTIVEDILPASYYSSTLLGIQADQRVLRTMICNYLPDVDVTLKEHDIELSLITLHWFLTLFASVVHMKILLRIWDLFFFDGSIVLFQVTLGMLKIKEPDLRQLENSAEIFNALSDIPGDIEDVDHLLDVSFKVAASLNDMVMETHRRRHLAYLMADRGALVGNPEAAPNLPKQHLSRSGLVSGVWHFFRSMLAFWCGYSYSASAGMVVWRNTSSVQRLNTESLDTDLHDIDRENDNESIKEQILPYSNVHYSPPILKTVRPEEDFQTYVVEAIMDVDAEGVDEKNLNEFVTEILSETTKLIESTQNKVEEKHDVVDIEKNERNLDSKNEVTLAAVEYNKLKEPTNTNTGVQVVESVGQPDCAIRLEENASEPSTVFSARRI